MKKPEEKIIISLVRHFKVLRMEQELSHNKLAIRAGITRPAISQIESGKRTPTLIVCLKIARALNKNLGELLAQCEREIYKA